MTFPLAKVTLLLVTPFAVTPISMLLLSQKNCLLKKNDLPISFLESSKIHSTQVLFVMLIEELKIKCRDLNKNFPIFLAIFQDYFLS